MTPSVELYVFRQPRNGVGSVSYNIAHRVQHSLQGGGGEFQHVSVPRVNFSDNGFSVFRGSSFVVNCVVQLFPTLLYSAGGSRAQCTAGRAQRGSQRPAPAHTHAHMRTTYTPTLSENAHTRHTSYITHHTHKFQTAHHFWCTHTQKQPMHRPAD